MIKDPLMRNFLLTIEYDGTDFFGWQRQPDRPTVQGTIEAALATVLGKKIQINGTSRTDAGVHAYGQRASFQADLPLPVDKLALVLNHRLSAKRGGPIRILKAEEKPLDFHARFNAKGKRYLYKIATAEETDLFRRNYYCRTIYRDDNRDSVQIRDTGVRRFRFCVRNTHTLCNS